MKTNIIYILFGGLALTLASCTTSQMAVQNTANGDDVYSSTVEAKKITYTPRRVEDYQSRNEEGDYYQEDSSGSRIDIDRRNPYSWRDSYYDNYLSYDPFYYDPFYSNWYRPGFSIGLGWNNWGWNSWHLGWNNWGWYDPFYYGWNSWYYNPWAYNPWYGPYRYNYWGMYSVYNPVYWGGGYYGGLWNGRVIENNPRPSRGVSGVRPDRTSSGRVSSGTSTGGRIQMPATRPSRTEGTVNRPGTSTRPGVTRPSARPGTGQSNTRPTRNEAPQRVERPTESSRPQSRPERYSPPQQSPSSWGGGSSGRSSSGSSGGGRSSSGGGGRPSR